MKHLIFLTIAVIQTILVRECQKQGLHPDWKAYWIVMLLIGVYYYARIAMFNFHKKK